MNLFQFSFTRLRNICTISTMTQTLKLSIRNNSFQSIFSFSPMMFRDLNRKFSGSSKIQSLSDSDHDHDHDDLIKSTTTTTTTTIATVTQLGTQSEANISNLRDYKINIEVRPFEISVVKGRSKALTKISFHHLSKDDIISALNHLESIQCTDMDLGPVREILFHVTKLDLSFSNYKHLLEGISKRLEIVASKYSLSADDLSKVAYGIRSLTVFSRVEKSIIQSLTDILVNKRHEQLSSKAICYLIYGIRDLRSSLPVTQKLFQAIADAIERTNVVLSLSDAALMCCGTVYLDGWTSNEKRLAKVIIKLLTNCELSNPEELSSRNFSMCLSAFQSMKLDHKMMSDYLHAINRILHSRKIKFDLKRSIDHILRILRTIVVDCNESRQFLYLVHMHTENSIKSIKFSTYGLNNLSQVLATIIRNNRGLGPTPGFAVNEIKKCVRVLMELVISIVPRQLNDISIRIGDLIRSLYAILPSDDPYSLLNGKLETKDAKEDKEKENNGEGMIVKEEESIDQFIYHKYIRTITSLLEANQNTRLTYSEFSSILQGYGKLLIYHNHVSNPHKDVTTKILDSLVNALIPILRNSTTVTIPHYAFYNIFNRLYAFTGRSKDERRIFTEILALLSHHYDDCKSVIVEIDGKSVRSVCSGISNLDANYEECRRLIAMAAKYIEPVSVEEQKKQYSENKYDRYIHPKDLVIVSQILKELESKQSELHPEQVLFMNAIRERIASNFSSER